MGDILMIFLHNSLWSALAMTFWRLKRFLFVYMRSSPNSVQKYGHGKYSLFLVGTHHKRILVHLSCLILLHGLTNAKKESKTTIKLPAARKWPARVKNYQQLKAVAVWEIPF